MIQRTRSLLAFVLSWLYVTAYTAVYVILTVFTFKKFSKYTRHHAAHGWGLFPLWLSGISVKKTDFEPLKEPDPRVVVFNHQSTLDLFWLAGTYATRGVAIIKKEFAYIPIINIALWSVDCIFIDRKNRQSAMAALAKVAKRIKDEKLSLYVAPEGTRSADGTLLPFKKGPFLVAMEGKLPIYPIVSYGPYKLQPKDKLLPRPGTIFLKCLPPIDTSDWTPETLAVKIKEVRAIMEAAIDELEHEAAVEDL